MKKRKLSQENILYRILDELSDIFWWEIQIYLDPCDVLMLSKTSNRLKAVVDVIISGEKFKNRKIKGIRNNLLLEFFLPKPKTVSLETYAWLSLTEKSPVSQQLLEYLNKLFSFEELKKDGIRPPFWRNVSIRPYETTYPGDEWEARSSNYKRIEKIYPSLNKNPKKKKSKNDFDSQFEKVKSLAYKLHKGEKSEPLLIKSDRRKLNINLMFEDIAKFCEPYTYDKRYSPSERDATDFIEKCQEKNDPLINQMIIKSLLNLEKIPHFSLFAYQETIDDIMYLIENKNWGRGIIYVDMNNDSEKIKKLLLQRRITFVSWFPKNWSNQVLTNCLCWRKFDIDLNFFACGKAEILSAFFDEKIFEKEDWPYIIKIIIYDHYKRFNYVEYNDYPPILVHIARLFIYFPFGDSKEENWKLMKFYLKKIRYWIDDVARIGLMQQYCDYLTELGIPLPVEKILNY